MKEIKAILQAYHQYEGSEVKGALATVVRVEGSSYRRVGARMLVLENGVFVGGISGGCLEGDALKRARFAIAKSEPSLVTYDTSENDAHQIGIGLGCNGIIDVLFCPLDRTDRFNPVEMLKKCIEGNRQTNILLTITSLSGFKSSLFRGQTIRYEGISSLDVFGNSDLARDIQEKIEHYKLLGKSLPKHFEAESLNIELFIEILPPETHLILMGGQYDILPLAKLAREVGFNTTVVANPLKINREIHQVAGAVVAPDEFEKLLTDSYTAVILMSHDLKTDRSNLVRALKTAAPFIGLLGPKVRAERIFNELTEEGFVIDNTDEKRIHAPVGLDIGAVSPEEIALSILGEIRADFSARDGSFLRLRRQSIHER